MKANMMNRSPLFQRIAEQLESKSNLPGPYLSSLEVQALLKAHMICKHSCSRRPCPASQHYERSIGDWRLVYIGTLGIMCRATLLPIGSWS